MNVILKKEVIMITNEINDKEKFTQTFEELKWSPQQIFIAKITKKIRLRKGLTTTPNYSQLIPDDISDIPKLIQNFQEYFNQIKIRVDCGALYEKAYEEWEKAQREIETEQSKKIFPPKEEDTSIYTSCIIEGEKIIEEVYSEEEGTKFAIWDGEKVDYVNEIQIADKIYKPIFAEEITKKAILLPSKAEEYGNDEELDKEILDFISQWLDVPEDFKMFALWNIKRSWVYEKFHTLNYLRALGDTGSGKSRFLDTLGSIHYKPIATSGATTSAPIFRIIDRWKGTLIMDEADFQKSDESQDIIKIINMGYEKGKFVMRCDQNEAEKIKFFDPFCPKILATRKTFEDKAVESRCITQVMLITTKEMPYNLNKDFFEKAQILRNKLLMWRFKNFNIINPNEKADFDYRGLEPRVKQIVSAFISLFKNNTNQLEKFKIFIQEYQKQLISERQGSFEGSIVEAIFELIKKEQINISAQDIIDEGQITGKDGKLVKPRGLNSILKSLGFGKTTVKRIGAKTKRCIPLEEEMLENLFERYGYDVTKVTVVMGDKANFLNIYDTYENKSGEHQQELPSSVRIQRNLRNNVTEQQEITIQLGTFRQVDRRLMPCKSCGEFHSKGWKFENVKDGSIWCDVCVGVI